MLMILKQFKHSYYSKMTCLFIFALVIDINFP